MIYGRIKKHCQPIKDQGGETMSTINTSYAAMQYGMNTAQKIRQQDSRKADAGEKVKETGETQSTETKKLSKKAQNVLEKLKDKYGNMDFFVSDTTDDTEARQIMSRGTKEYSVLLSSDELEKMAEDDSYYNSRVKDIDGAVSMSKQINGQFGFDSAYGKENGTQIAQIGIRLNDDGTTTYFVELEKLSEKQKERIENVKEKKAEDAKKADKSAEKAETVKKTSVQANSMEELQEKIRNIDWDSIKEETLQTKGGKFDFRV